MFCFVFGVTNGRRDLDHAQSMLCTQCGSYGSYRVFVTFMELVLFFIPCFRWNKQYYVQTSCCGRIYQLDQEKGRRIERGEAVTINPEDLTAAGWDYSSAGKTCSYCGFSTKEDFDYCPKCGHRF